MEACELKWFVGTQKESGRIDAIKESALPAVRVVGAPTSQLCFVLSLVLTQKI